MPVSVKDRLMRRPLGRTGEYLSVIGLGGIVVMDETPEHAGEVVREAFEAGVNYFDVAPTYGDAEQKLGPALEPFRQKVFLACKTAERHRPGAARELEQSLKNLRTDYLDLYQLHSLETRQDIEQAFGPGGAMEVFVKAREQGKVRFLGFSAHSAEAAEAALGLYSFDTVLLPLNFGCWLGGGFGPQVVEKARSQGMGVLALKAGAHRPRHEGKDLVYAKTWYHPLEDEELIGRSFRFTLSLPVTACLPPGEEKFFRMALAAARQLRPLSQEDRAVLEREAAALEPLFSYPSVKY